MNIRKILFPTDFSGPSNRALDHALVLAHRFKATLVMLHVEVPYATDPNNPRFEFPKLEELFQAIREQVEKRLNSPEQPVVTGDIEIVHDVKRAVSAAPEILQYAEVQEIDMIVMGTHGRTGLGHFLLGSTAERVVHGAKIPVLTIRHGEDLLLAHQGKYERVLVPTDFSVSSRNALKAGAELADKFGGKLLVVHVVEPVLSPQNLFAGDPSPIIIDNELSLRSQAAFDDFAEGLVPKDTVINLRAGSSHKEIIAEAKEKKADLVVMADQGWSAVERWLLGGTTEKVIRRSPVPVLTVK
ncbi:MAG: universal stress protein [bacterium]